MSYKIYNYIKIWIKKRIITTVKPEKDEAVSYLHSKNVNPNLQICI